MAQICIGVKFRDQRRKRVLGAQREEFSTQYHLGPIGAEGEKKPPLGAAILVCLADEDRGGPGGSLLHDKCHLSCSSSLKKNLASARGAPLRPRPALPRQWPGNRRKRAAGRPYRPCFPHSSWRGPRGRAGPAMAYGGYGLCEKQGLYGRPAALFRRFPGHWPNFGAEALAVAEAAPLAELTNYTDK